MILAGCAGGTALSTPQIAREPASVTNAGKIYQPLAVGNYWKFTCNHLFPIVDRVTSTFHVKGQLVYALSLQIPSSPTKSVRVIQLLANDKKGNTWIYGYLIGGKVHAVKPAEIVAAKPVPYTYYDYPAPTHGKIPRLFLNFENTNKTPLGTFRVAPYFESARTHNYGYSLGRGVMEEDHGPHYRYDCLIEKFVLH
jgi:hypothetical protein